MKKITNLQRFSMISDSLLRLFRMSANAPKRDHSKIMLFSGITLALLVGGGITYAVIPSNNVITGCYTKTGGTIRVIDATTGSCTSKETRLDWNVQGPQGPQGVQGPQGLRGDVGPQGPAGANGVSRAYIKHVDLADAPQGGDNDVIWLDLPAGAYLVNITGVMLDDSGSGQDEISAVCLLFRGNNPNWLAYTEIDTASAASSILGPNASFAISTAAFLGAQDRLVLKCGSRVGSDSVAQVTMTAIQMNEIIPQ
jgi:hypothetical protein